MLVKSITFKKIFFTCLLIVIGIISSRSYNSLTNKHPLDIRLAKTAHESQVIRVVDGDTIIVALNHKPETIRLLGINTPETVAPSRPVQCFGPEASARTKELLTYQIVQLEADPSQDNKDKYNRLLRFVFLEEKNVNESLVRDGYAREYTFDRKNPYLYQAQFRQAQREAKKNKRGLWKECLK